MYISVAESFLHELKRRNVFKVATAYIVLAWVVIQVTGEAVPALLLPEWVNTLVFFLGVIGFPFVLLFAWAYELTPEGIKLESEIDRSESITTQTGQKLNVTIITLLVIALAYFIYESRFMERQPAEEIVVQEQPEVVEEEPLEARITTAPSTSIAVLPFVNLSSDPEQEFFSDGISEEILNVLAQTPNLLVTSRSSAFAFKGKEINLSEVAEKLGVANILEGSVRKAGNRIRITAQLIDAATDTHLWSSSYDRELNDIFAIQDEISSSIVNALKDRLGIEQVEIVASQSVDLSAHEAYLKGRHLIENRNKDDLELALVEFDKAITIEPGYAKAWMGKAWATLYLSEVYYGEIPIEISLERVTLANDRALKLNPNLAESYAIKGLTYGVQAMMLNNPASYTNAAEYLEKAIQLNPNFVPTYVWYSQSLDLYSPETLLLNMAKSIALREKAYKLNPWDILSVYEYADDLLDLGEFEEVTKLAERIELINLNSHYSHLLRLKIAQNNHEYGKVLYHRTKVHELSPYLRSLMNYAVSLGNLGFIDELTALLENTDFSAIIPSFTGNNELAISQGRASFPRNDNDIVGRAFRAGAEVLAQNCEAAIEYFKGTSCVECIHLVVCHQRVGNDDIAESLIESRKSWVDAQKEAGEIPLSWRGYELWNHYLEGDLDAFMAYHKQEVEAGMVLGSGILYNPSYSDIREHKDWPALLAVSEQNKEKHRKVYLDLMAQDSSNN